MHPVLIRQVILVVTKGIYQTNDQGLMARGQNVLMSASGKRQKTTPHIPWRVDHVTLDPQRTTNVLNAANSITFSGPCLSTYMISTIGLSTTVPR